MLSCSTEKQNVVGWGVIMLLGICEWLLFIANSVIYQLYHGENKLIVNEMIMRSALY
jgi:hypothetical protein